jgi:hypothetical protein
MEYVEEAGGTRTVRLERGTTVASWNGQVLRMKLRWTPQSTSVDAAYREVTRRSAVPCLVLPDMLPEVHDAQSRLRIDIPRYLTRLRYATPLPPVLDAGGVSSTVNAGSLAPEMLQVAIIEPTSAAGASDEDLTVVSLDPMYGRDACERAMSYAKPLCRFLREELGLTGAAHPIIALADEEVRSLLPPLGAFCPVDPEEVGVVRPDVGKPTTVIRLLSQAWLAGGIRIWGENSVSLRLALGGAVGLRWAEQQGAEQFVTRALDDMGRRVTAADQSGHWSEADLVRAIQLPLFRALRRRELCREIGALINDYWGRYMPQAELIDLLRRRQVEVPHVFA